MKFYIVLAACVGGIAATPFPNAVNVNDLDERHPRKCQAKDRSCCQYLEYDYKDWHGYGPEYRHGRTITVKPGHKIQEAINSASRGDRIVVEAGPYAEQLTIDKDGIQLIGHDAILTPPETPVENICSGLSGDGNQTGICVTGSGVELAPFVTEHKAFLSVQRPVKNVLITGFQVKGFSGINIAVVGARNARVTKNTLTDGAMYGALTLGSIDTLIHENTVTSTTLSAIAVCMDNKSGVFITKNQVSNHFVGLCVQTRGAEVRRNTVSGSCFGIFVDPGIEDAKIIRNYVGPPNPICSLFGVNSGIIVDGAINTKVLDNVVEGQKLDGKGVGISVVDDPCTQQPLSLKCLALGRPAIASGNVVLRNTLKDNDLNLDVKTTGSNNLVACNRDV